MSYCRTSGLSEVYIFGSATHLECYVSNQVAKRGMIPAVYTVPYEEPRNGTAERAMLGHCYFLIDQGVHVPGYAMRRLVEEIEGFSSTDYLNQTE